VGPITGLDISEKRFTSHPCRVSKFGPSSPQSHPAYCDRQVNFLEREGVPNYLIINHTVIMNIMESYI
jgi:hypothetical protein